MHIKAKIYAKGKHQYVWSAQSYEKLSFTIKFTCEDWNKYVAKDVRGKPYFLPYDYTSVVVNEWQKQNYFCNVINVRRAKFLQRANTLEISAYCVEGAEIACKLYKLRHTVENEELNSSDGSKLFEVWESTNPRLHSEQSRKTNQLRGPNRLLAKQESLRNGPLEYADKIIISTETDKIICDKPSWPITQNTIYNLRREARAEDYLHVKVMESLHSMWLVEKTLPRVLKKGKAEFRFLKTANDCPLQIVLISHPQTLIMDTEFKKFQPSLSEPLLVYHLDGTGAIVSKPYGHKNMSVDNLQQRMLFSLVRPVKTEGKPKATIVPLATYITNDRSTDSLRFFLWNIRVTFENDNHYWPPFDVIVVDKDWAEINAVLKEFNNHLSIHDYLKTAYDYVNGDSNAAKGILVLIQLCSVHLFKLIHRDTETYIHEPWLREIVNVLFVHIIHAKTYKEFLGLFKGLVTILLAEDDSRRKAVREMVLFEKNKDIFNTSISLESGFNDSIKRDANTDAMYKSSPFYKDCCAVLDSMMDTFTNIDNTKKQFICYAMQHYFSILPLISAILVPSKHKQNELPVQVRFHNNYSEGYFCVLKEMLRRMENRIGKMPIRIDVLIKILKQNLLAFVLRYQKRMPHEKVRFEGYDVDNIMEDVLEQYNRQGDTTLSVIAEPEIHEKESTKYGNQSNINQVTTPKTPKHQPIQRNMSSKSISMIDIDKSVSKWKRGAKPDTPPNSPSLSRKKMARRMFDATIGCITNITCEIHIRENYPDKLTSPVHTEGVHTELLEREIRFTTVLLPVEPDHLNESSSSTLCSIVPEQIPKGKLQNGFYPNFEFYERVSREDSILGFIMLNGLRTKVYLDELKCLSKGEKLSNFTLDNLAELMVSKSSAQNVKLIDCYNTRYLFGIGNNKLESTYFMDEEKVKTIRRYFNSNVNTLVCPVLWEEHFYLLIIDLQNKTIAYLDSARSSERMKTIIEGFFQTLQACKILVDGPDDVKKWTIIEPDGIPQQNDAVSCGVYVLAFLEMFLTNRQMISFDVHAYRNRLKIFLLENLVSIYTICSICGDICIDKSLVKSCCYCGRKVHDVCIDKMRNVIYETVEDIKCELCNLNKMTIRRNVE